MDDQSAQSTSYLFKIARAVDGCDDYRLRVEMAFELMGRPFGRSDFIQVTRAVADEISCTIEGTVDTSGVPDDQIIAAIEALPPIADDAE